MDEWEREVTRREEEEEICTQPKIFNSGEGTHARRQTTAPPFKRRRRSNENTFEKDLDYISAKNTSDSTENNPDKLFLLSLLPRVSELNSSDKLDFQIKVLQLLKYYNDASKTES